MYYDGRDNIEIPCVCLHALVAVATIMGISSLNSGSIACHVLHSKRKIRCLVDWDLTSVSFGILQTLCGFVDSPPQERLSCCVVYVKYWSNIVDVNCGHTDRLCLALTVSCVLICVLMR